jgi:hypothetical protein
MRANEVYCELNVKLSSTETTRVHLYRKIVVYLNLHPLPFFIETCLVIFKVKPAKKTLSLKKDARKQRSSLF